MATVKDIADKAGVSIGTVDRILHNRGRFSAQTAERVRRITEELNYRPNVIARHLSQAREYRVGVLLPAPEQDSGYWALPLHGIRRAERDLSPFNLTLHVHHFDRYDSASFTRAGRRLVSEEYDGLMMAPLRADEAHELLRSVDPETPVVFVDTDLPGASRMSYIGQDSYQSGRLAAQLMDLMTHGRGHALVITPEAENEHLDSRIRGFRENATGPTELVRVAVEIDHNLAAFREVIGRQVGRDTSGIFVVDAAAHYTASYLSEVAPRNGRKRVHLIGYDLVAENRRWMEAGVIDALLTQRPAEQGYRALHSLYQRIFLDQACPERIYTPIDIVVRENLQYMTDEENL